jgi:hypothetical protein
MLTKINFNQAGTRDLRRDTPHQIQWNQWALQAFRRPKPPQNREKLQPGIPAGPAARRGGPARRRRLVSPRIRAALGRGRAR